MVGQRTSRYPVDEGSRGQGQRIVVPARRHSISGCRLKGDFRARRWTMRTAVKKTVDEEFQVDESRLKRSKLRYSVYRTGLYTEPEGCLVSDRM